jgi:hypothetical protein
MPPTTQEPRKHDERNLVDHGGGDEEAEGDAELQPGLDEADKDADR